MIISNKNLLAFIILPFFLLSCEAANPKPVQLDEMVPRNPELVFPSSGKSCSLGNFEGRKEKKDLIWRVTTIDLKDAVAEGLKHSQIFTAVYKTEQKDSDYTLTAKLLGQPWEGSFTTTQALYVEYRIIRNDTGETIFRKTIQTSSHTTGVAITRLRMASQNVVRENVKMLLEDISKIQF